MSGKKQITIYVFLCIMAGFLIILNYRIVYITDDWHFMFIFDDFLPTQDTKRVQSINDIYASMRNYYLGSGGRVFSHTILSIFLMIGKPLFNIINTGIFLLTAFLMYKLTKRNENSIIVIVPVIILMLFYLPMFGETCLWMSGAINYLWMATLTLGFVCTIKAEDDLSQIPNGGENAAVKRKKKIIIFSCILAFLAGFTNEATGGMLIVFIIMQILLGKKKLNKINIIRMLLVIPGEMFILMSPGNSIRAEEISKTEVFSVSVAMEKLYETFEWIVSDGYYILIIPIVVFPLIYRKKIRLFADSISYFISSLAGMGALALSGTFIVRAHFLNVIFIIMAFVSSILVLIEIIKQKPKEEYNRLWKIIYERSGLIKKISLFMAFAFACVFMGLNSYQFIKATSDDLIQLDRIEKAADKGENIKYHPVMHYDAGILYPWEASHSKTYEAAWQSEYYGVKIEVEGVE